MAASNFGFMNRINLRGMVQRGKSALLALWNM